MTGQTTGLMIEVRLGWVTRRRSCPQFLPSDSLSYRDSTVDLKVFPGLEHDQCSSSPTTSLRMGVGEGRGWGPAMPLT